MIEQLKFLMADLKRWKFSSGKELFYVCFELGVWATILFRLSRALFVINIPVLKIIFRLIGFLIFKISEIVLGVGVRPGADIGPGFFIGHAGSILINESVKAGKNLNVGPGVLIGLAGLGNPGVPVIGDDVYIGVGAKLLGNIKIGNNVRIGANSVVVQDVPSNVTVFGVPAKIVGPAFNFKKRQTT